MFRKILIAAVLSLGSFAPFAMPAPTEAHDVVVRRHHRYEVFYRQCDHEPWRCAGSYYSREDAFREVRHLRHRGFEAIVR